MSSSKCFLSAKSELEIFYVFAGKARDYFWNQKREAKDFEKVCYVDLVLDVNDLGDLALFVKYNKMNSCVHIPFSSLTSL